jgi:hypothetical protein
MPGSQYFPPTSTTSSGGAVPSAATVAPTTPAVGQLWTNTATTTVAGVPTGATAAWNGGAWIIIAANTPVPAPTPATPLATTAPLAATATAAIGTSSAAARADHVHPASAGTGAAAVPAPTSTAIAPTAPVTNQLWTNTSAATVAGVPAGATAVWTGTAWQSIKADAADWWLDRGMPNAAMTLSGTAALSAARVFSWTNRFVVAGGSQGGWSAVGYYDMTMPPAGTVITSLSTSTPNITATAAGITLPNGWVALYYKMNAGASSSVASNYFIASFSGNSIIPNNCVLIATFNPDNQTLKLGDGKVMTVGSTYNPAATANITQFIPNGVVMSLDYIDAASGTFGWKAIVPQNMSNWESNGLYLYRKTTTTMEAPTINFSTRNIT